MADFNEFQHSNLHDDGILVVCGAQKIGIPQGGPHVRQTDVRLPFFEGLPEFSVHVFALDEPPLMERLFGKDRETFVVYDLTFHLETTYLGCKVSAQNIRKAENSSREYACSYVAKGLKRAE